MTLCTIDLPIYQLFFWESLEQQLRAAALPEKTPKLLLIIPLKEKATLQVAFSLVENCLYHTKINSLIAIAGLAHLRCRMNNVISLCEHQDIHQ
jgi:hypothetical protein